MVPSTVFLRNSEGTKSSFGNSEMATRSVMQSLSQDAESKPAVVARPEPDLIVMSWGATISQYRMRQKPRRELAGAVVEIDEQAVLAQAARNDRGPASFPWCGHMLPLPLRPSSCIHGHMTEPLLGRSINRLEDERFVQGRGRYVADLAAPNVLHGVVVRSTHAHARIVAIRVDGARQIPGVAAVLTGLDIASDNIGPLPCATTNIPMTTPLVVPPCHGL